MTGRPCVTALIVTYESRNFILPCLDSLLQSANAWIERVVVIDNCSQDQIGDVVRDVSPIVEFVQLHENIGFGRAINRAAQNASSEYLLILNPDTLCDPSTVAELAHFLDHRPQAGACGPYIETAAGNVDRAARRGFPTPLSALGYASRLDRIFPHWKWIGQYHKRWLPTHYETMTDSLSGCCLLIRRSVFEQVGGFDPDYFLFGEDIDLCWKLAESGWERWYVPAAKLIHVKHASMNFASVRAKAEFFKAMEIFVGKRLAARYHPASLALIKSGIRLWSKVTGRW